MTSPTTLRPSVAALARTGRQHWIGRRLGRVAGRQVRNLKRLVAGKPVQLIGHGSMTLDHDDLQVARDWLRRPEDWQDPTPVREFEQSFANLNASAHAFAFSAGCAALSACLEALDIGAGNEVILPGYTCVVVPNALA